MFSKWWPKREPVRRGYGGRNRLRLERLEDRRLLAADLQNWLSWEAEGEGPATENGLGVIGDSLSDEYSGEAYSYARNWVELLADEDKLSVGQFAAWGDVRREGYEYNWASSGADSAEMLADGQHTGVAEQIAAGKIQHAVLSIGQNDFFPGGEAYIGIYLDLWTQQEVDQHVDNVAANIATALQTVNTNNVELVLANIIDYNVAELPRQLFNNADRREAVTSTIVSVNQQLAALAQQHNIPLVDTFRLSKDFFGTNHAPLAFQTIGGNEITNTGGTEATNAFVDDGVHPHTITQAALANVYLEAFNVGYGNQFPLFSEQQMVTLAGLTYGGDDTLNMDYADYVILPRAWQNPLQPLDVTDDGHVVPGDVLAIINELNSPRYHDTTGRLVLPVPATAPPPYYDVNGDEHATPLDALAIINFLNADPEGEGPIARAALSEPAWNVNLDVDSLESALARIADDLVRRQESDSPDDLLLARR